MRETPQPLATLAAFVFLLQSCVLSAEEPTVSYVFPAGGQRGTVVKFRVGGHFLHGQASFRMYGPGVEAGESVRETDTVWFEGPVIPQPASQRKEDYPKDHLGQVKIAADAPLGDRDWRVWTSQGGTPAMKFVVGDLPELVEEEIDGRPIPVEVALPVTINGRIFPREDVDVWAFRAKRGQTTWAEVCAARLGSPLDSRVEILGPDGRRLVENTDYYGTDSFVSFTAPADGVYQARIHDINFGGLQHYVYRLTLSAGPHVEGVYPLGGRRGSKVNLTLMGSNVPSSPVEVDLAGEADGATARRRVTIDGRDTNVFLLEVGDLPEVLEQEPNDESPQATSVTLPAVLNGRIDRPGDADAWKFTAAKGEILEWDLRASRWGSPLDAVLEIRSAQGKVLAQADDTGGQTDCRLTFRPPADGAFFARVTDRFKTRGGPRFAYRLHVAPPDQRPDYRVSLAADSLNVFRGGQGKLKISVERRGGFQGEIKLQCEGLPRGVTVSPPAIPAKKNVAQLVFQADGKAPVGGYEVALSAAADIGERQNPPVARLFLAVGMPTPFKFKGDYLISYAGQGVTHQRKYSLERNGYDGPLQVSLADRQTRHLQGVRGPLLTVPQGADEFVYPAQLPPWLVIGRTSRTVLMAVGEVKDEQGRPHKVSYSSAAQSDQIIVLADPGPLSVKALKRSIPMRPGGVVDLPVRVQRGAGLKLPVTLELAAPAHMRGLRAAPVHVAAGRQQATLRIEMGPHAGPFNMPVVIRASARRGTDRIVAEDRFEVAPIEQREK